MRGAQIKAHLHWLQVGDKASKEFFNIVQARYFVVGIKHIREDQQVLSYLPIMLLAFVHHCEKVFTSQGPSTESNHDLQFYVVVTPNRLDREKCAFCMQKLSLFFLNLKKVFFTMGDDKAPGCEGFPCEFYKSLQEGIGPDQHQVYHEAYNIHSLGSIINKGDIKFIPKVDNPEDIYNWRPVTLLNVSYKIIAKALSLKILHFFLQIVSPEDTSFIKYRYILDNIIFVLKGMEWAFQSKQQALFLNIYFPKAYDRLNGLSVWPCFKPQGLVQSFCNQFKFFLEMLILVLI